MQKKRSHKAARNIRAAEAGVSVLEAVEWLLIRVFLVAILAYDLFRVLLTLVAFL